MPESIAERLQEIHDRIAEACRRAGRPPSGVTLVAVSKKMAPGQIREAAEAGQRIFGESRVQECVEKIPALPSRLSWHFIGHLQSNKVRKIVGLCSCFHSVDSSGLAGDLNRVAGESGASPEVLLQVNVAGEARKSGFSPDSVTREGESLLDLPNLAVTGLMTIPPLHPDPEQSRRHFAALRELRDDLAARTGVPLPALSMGMSGDFEIAIEEGATLVRIGSLLFGDR